MKISKIRIANFRSIKDMTIDIQNYTSILGSNGAGKSNVLRALSIFFGDIDPKNIDKDDWHNEEVSAPIEISLTFEGLTPDEQKEFKHYFRDEKLVLMAEITAPRNIKYCGWRMVLDDFKELFKANDDGALKDEIIALYNELRKTHPGLPIETGKKAAIEAARAYEEAADTHQKKLLKSSHELYGGTDGGKLNKYIHWVYVPAVQDMSTEGEVRRGNSFAKLIGVLSENESLEVAIATINDDVNSKVAGAISNHQGDMDLLSEDLSREFQRWAHKDASILVSREAGPNPVPSPTPVGKIKEHSFSGDVDSFGNGLHRAYLFSLLITLAERQAKKAQDKGTSPTIILGVEEPELYQHPHQSRNISDALRKLSALEGFQTLMTTHSPFLIQPDIPESIVRLSKSDAGTVWCEHDISALSGWDSNKIPRDVFRMLNEGMAEMFFSDFVVFVEGPEDVAYLQAYWRAKGKQRLPHIIAVGGKPNLLKPIRLAKSFNIDFFVVFDADRQNASHGKNKKIAELLGIDEAEQFSSPLIEENFAVWPNEIDKTIDEEMPNFNAAGLEKEPLKIAVEVARVVAAGESSASLDDVWLKIEPKI